MEKRLSIAMFGHKHVLSREGGVEIVVKELATRMAAKGHRVICYDRKCKSVEGNIGKKPIRYKNVNIKPVWTIEKKGLAALTSSIAAAWYAAWSNADIVHIHAEGPAAMCWLPKLAGKKVIVTIHGLDWKRSKWGTFASNYIKFGEKQATKWADNIIVLSKNVQRYFKEQYNRDTVYIPNGITKPKYRKAAEITKNWCLKKNSYVLFLGRIVPEKGIHYLIEAWNEIKSDKTLVIAGESSDTDLYLKSLKKKAGDNVVFVGFQRGKILEELYSNAYLYCLPSDVEGMPLSLLEAMSYGNCCIVSDIPECTEVVSDKAYVFHKGNIQELKMLIQKLLDKPELVTKNKNEISDYVCKNYDWDKVVSKTLEVYFR